MAQIGKGGTYEENTEVTKVYGVCNKAGTYFGDRYKISNGDFLGKLTQGQVTSNCSDATYDCSNAWCKSSGNNNNSLVSQYQNQQDYNKGNQLAYKKEDEEDYKEGNKDNTDKGFEYSYKDVASSQEEDSFAGEYDESTNDPNKTYKNIYWIDRTKDNHKIPENLRGKFWTHIQAGFLTEQDKKTNYNVRAIGDDNYPQNHFGTVSNGIDESDDEFIGDISEYNSAELTERILENSYHRINTVYREYRKEILNLSNSEGLNEKNYDTFFNNNQTKVFAHNFGTRNVAVNFFSKSSKTSMNSWSSISYKILDDNKVEVTYYSPNSNVGHDIITTINNLSPNSDDDVYEVGNLKEGYLYKPHYRIKIREYESIITVEDDDSDFVDIPSYATLQSTRREVSYNSFVNGEKTYKDNTPLNMINDPVFKTVNTYRYRRLLDIGEIDVLGFGVDYPFNSGAHYIYVDSRFYLQRQDPPFKPFEEIVSLKLPDNVKLFEYLVKSPNYKGFDIVSGGDIDSEVLDGTKDPLEVDVTINGSEGNYELGERYVVGKELSVPTIKTKDLDDVC